MDRSRPVKTVLFAFSLLSLCRSCRPSGSAIGLVALGGLPSGASSRRFRAFIGLRSPFVG